MIRGVTYKGGGKKGVVTVCCGPILLHISKNLFVGEREQKRESAHTNTHTNPIHTYIIKS